MWPTYLIKAFVQTQERRGSNEEHVLSILSPSIMYIARQLQLLGYLALGFPWPKSKISST